MAKMIVVTALASLFGEGRKKIAENGDRIKLPESDALRLKELGLVKIAADTADESTDKPNKTKASSKADDSADVTGTGDNA